MARFKELLAAGKLVRVFAATRLVNTVSIDMFALAGGYHGFWLDQEHVGLTYADIQMATVAGRANGFDNFVRMAPTNYAAVTQNLEAGAGGVMAAQISSAGQAEEFVTWAKFAPRGRRGINTGGRDANYTHLKIGEFAERANREHLVLIQIETLGALEQAEQIAAIEGVDMLFLGPADLSQALGIIGRMTDNKIWDAVDHIAAACKKHGKHWGTVPADPAFAERAYDKGCRMLTMASDIKVFRSGIETEKAAYQKLFDIGG